MKRFAIAVVLLLGAGCARATPRSEPAIWARYVTGFDSAKIIDGIVLVGMRPKPNLTKTEAYDEQSGKRLWRREDALPISGSAMLLAADAMVERVNARSGDIIWQSRSTCSEPASPAADATYAAIIGGIAYIGCSGGRIVALRLTDGSRLSAAHPMYVDSYDQIIPLGNHTLGVGGEAGGAYLHRASAILKRNSLSAVVVFPPDRHILGMHGANVVAADTCCQGLHSDSWPANIWLISPSSGESVDAVSLHPYRRPLSSSSDEPGPGITIAAGNALYVATHHAIFAYNLDNLHQQPRTLYGNLANMPTTIDDRYVEIQEGTPRNVSKVAVLDSDAGMRAIWSSKGQSRSSDSGATTVRVYTGGHVGLVNAARDCGLSASDGKYAVMLCQALNVAADAHVGSSPKAITWGRNVSLPQTMAMYAVGKTLP